MRLMCPVIEPAACPHARHGRRAVHIATRRELHHRRSSCSYCQRRSHGALIHSATCFSTKQRRLSPATLARFARLKRPGTLPIIERPYGALSPPQISRLSSHLSHTDIHALRPGIGHIVDPLFFFSPCSSAPVHRNLSPTPLLMARVRDMHSLLNIVRHRTRGAACINCPELQMKYPPDAYDSLTTPSLPFPSPPPNSKCGAE
ncbi:hypothetical protein GQ53DRAFT_81152 [Thozetella sp. PMI_491]|nr:hypothetical protein GQ53DRAFT_81152 [Thozetella sp. PMI_491]